MTTILSRRMRYSTLCKPLQQLIDRKYARDHDRRHVRYNVLSIADDGRGHIDVSNECIVHGRLMTVEQSSTADGKSDDV